MQHKATVPEAVLRATLADETIVGSVVGDEVPMVRDLPGSTVALLAFVDEHRATGLQDFLFVAAKVFVLYSPARERAFVVDLGTPGRAAKPANAVDRAGG